jgi:hypothetical protein
MSLALPKLHGRQEPGSEKEKRWQWRAGDIRRGRTTLRKKAVLGKSRVLAGNTETLTKFELDSGGRISFQLSLFACDPNSRLVV